MKPPLQGRCLHALLAVAACGSSLVAAQGATPAPGAPPPTTSPAAGPTSGTPPPAINPLVVKRLEPPGGPLEGSTTVVVHGHGFRNFGSLMRCRFGSLDVAAKLHVDQDEVADQFNHTKISCVAPKSPTPLEQSVTVEVSLNGQEFSASGVTFRYFRHPALTGISPTRGSAFIPQTLTLTRSTAPDSGGWRPTGEAAEHRCKFVAVVQPTGRRQVPFSQVVNASVLDDTEVQCVSPTVHFVAPVKVEVTLNGQQYGTDGPVFVYEDNWHAPPVTGVAPSGRQQMASCRVGSVAYFFGGEDGNFESRGAGYVDDLWALHLDAMSDFYPSQSSYDLGWQKLSLSSGGDPPSPRSQATLAAWGTTLLLFGGASSMYGDMHNATYEYSTQRKAWQQVAVSGGPVSPRSAHSAVVCSLAAGCATSDGRPRMYVFGGWGMAPCSGVRQCLAHNDDLVALDLNAMVWQPVLVNEEQPRPPARKGHTATLVNGTRMLVFGGSAWVADPDADNSYGFSTQHVNDLWAVDLSGADGFTWRAVHSVGARPPPREGHGATLLANRYLVIHGGYDHTHGWLNDTHVLDTQPTPMVWTRPTLTGRRPSSRSGHALLGLEHDELLVVGGMSLHGFESDVHILQLGTGNERHFPGISHE
jgi:hypothetical protein